MDQAGDTLPIRLRPRKGSQIFLLIFFGFFFVFAIVWMILASQPGGRLHFNDVEVTDPYWRAMFPLFGIPFALVGMCGLAVALLKVLPNSPCYHLELSPDGLTYRTLLKTQSFAWRDLPALTVKEETDSESGTMYEVVAVDEGSGKPREMLSIPVDQYGTRNNKESAIELAAWINRLRELALQSRLNGAAQIEIPDGFARYVVGLSMAARPSATAERTVTRAR